MRCPVPRIAAAVVLLLAACNSDDGPGPGGPPPEIGPIFQRGLLAPWFGSSSNAHEAGLDFGVKRTGTAAYVRALLPRPDTAAFGYIVQSIAALDYRGKRLRLSGYVRADSIDGRGAGLWMRIDAPTRTVGFDNMNGYGRPILGSSDWTQYAVVLDVPTDAVGVTFGMLLSGGGVARVDDLSLEVVDATVPTTGTALSGGAVRDSATTANSYERLPHAAENLDFEGTAFAFDLAYAWLKSAARPFATDLPGAALDDLAELGAITGGARVAAFGEATHGTKEFFRMKHRAFEYLVEKQGYTHFLIEATMPEARALDRYVTTGQGDPARLLANLYFWTWNTEEVLDLITWMRTYNVRAGAPRLRFFGFDMQFPHQALDSIPALLGRVDAQVKLQAQTAVRCFDAMRGTNGHLSSTRYAALPELEKNGCAAGLASLAEIVRAHRTDWSATSGADDIAWLEQYITLAQQWERMARASDFAEVFNQRDRAMADNVLWIAGREPQARHFVWAHNGHVSRRPNTMGRHLSTALGAQYRNIAFTFGNGRFNSVAQLSDGSFDQLQAHTIQGPNANTLESLFNATLEPRLILDTRKVLSGEAGSFTLNRRPIPMRSIGSVYSATNAAGYYEQALLPFDYDGIIWFVNTRESRLLPFSP